MARTVVLIFLLDTIPEFPLILNKTLQETFSKTDPQYTLQECNPIIATSILQRANVKIDENTPNWKLIQTKEGPIEELGKLPPDSAYNEDDIFDNSIPDSVENSLEDIQDYFDNNEISNFGIQQELQQKDNSSVAKSRGVGLESPPFLVAIFETVSNVTANTCAGTLMSPHWVVTAASCVGVLRFYGNGTNSTENSRYTIVVGSTNPLIDGSVHNVTEIRLHPPFNTMDHARNSSKANSLNVKLAVMRVNPGLAVEKINILEEKEVSDAVAYGWILAVNESSNVILPSSIPVKRTNQTHCHAKESGFASSALCFSAELMIGRNSTKLGIGGPALVHNRMLGVVTDDRVPLLVEPLAAHPWIEQLINADSL